EEGRAWVERTLASFTLEALAAQLVVEWIPGSYVSPTSPEFEPLRSWVAEERIGGVSPSIGSPLAYAARLNALQRAAEVPRLVASDFENGGPGMRLSGSYALPSMLPQGGGTAFPPTMAFGAIGEERFAYEYGRITAREARAVGVHMLFAPVLDVNSNPDNPVISTRSFGADPDLVARLGAAFIRGARDGGALTTGKHFPGHGDTSVDSHVGIPVVEADRVRLDTLELVPFRRAIEEGVDGIMTAHVQLPRVLGPCAPPATLADGILTDLLRRDLGFDGLVLTDALTMRAITDLYGIEEASVRSVEAGADVILAPRAVPEVVDAVVEAVRSGRLTRARLEASARRILELKARLRLHEGRAVSLEAVEAVVGSGPHLAFADSASSRSRARGGPPGRRPGPGAPRGPGWPPRPRSGERPRPTRSSTSASRRRRGSGRGASSTPGSTRGSPGCGRSPSTSGATRSPGPPRPPSSTPRGRRAGGSSSPPTCRPPPGRDPTRFPRSSAASSPSTPTRTAPCSSPSAIPTCSPRFRTWAPTSSRGATGRSP